MAPERTVDRTSFTTRGTSERAAEQGQLRCLDTWAHCAPIRLAGYEEDLAEPHILPGID
ncbi:hypothetical protein [Streptomyces sp. NPDC048111]|uniref:hypothetical protein n=1 Tax=Streptomyces sp. NPDC048111 TaxID=3365500 RepID=UPI0037148B37